MSGEGSTPDGSDITVRQARADDHEAVAAFTSDTWADRDQGDYLAEAFPSWVEGDDRRTFVAADDDRAVALCQAVRLSEHEGWMQGMRVDPDYRGLGLSRAVNDAGFRWLTEQGCTVARNMVFSWNVAGLGGSRSNGFSPGTEFRWAHPRPDSEATPAVATGANPDAAWAFWSDSAARDHLLGLALDDEESWALSELTRERLRTAADDGRLLTVRDGGVRGFSLRNRTYERETDEGAQETWAEYAVGAWADTAAARSLFAAVARDAAGVDADRTRVLIPESVQWVSDAAVARTRVSDEPDFVMRADLTAEDWT